MNSLQLSTFSKHILTKIEKRQISRVVDFIFVIFYLGERQPFSEIVHETIYYRLFSESKFSKEIFNGFSEIVMFDINVGFRALIQNSCIQ